VVSREDIGSWLDGGAAPDGKGSERLGLPPTGRGSLASLGRRAVALLIDWAAASLVAYLFQADRSWGPLIVFALENLLLVSTVGYTVGHRLLGLQVRVLGAPQSAWVGFGRGAVRTALLCLVIPAVVWDRDGRGLHDKAAGTVIVRR
jgi:uncharacterized RDD family membrane protein YckC